MLPENFHADYHHWKNGEITGTVAAKECGMPLSTFRYRAEIYEKAKLSQQMRFYRNVYLFAEVFTFKVLLPEYKYFRYLCVGIFLSL